MIASGAQWRRVGQVMATAVFVGVLLMLAQPAEVFAAQWYEEFGIASKHELVSPAAVPKLVNALDSRNDRVRKAAAGILSKIGPPAQQAAPKLLMVMAQDRNANVRKAAMVALYKMGYSGSDFLQALEVSSQSDAHARLRQYAGKLATKVRARGVTAGVAVASAPQAAPAPFNLNLPKAAEENRYAVAVIIGNRNYSSVNKDVPDVDFAHNDADAMYQYVTQALGYRPGNVILLKDATQADMVSTFGAKGNVKGKLYDWLRPQQSDIFIFYSGHGAPGLSDGRGYLLPVDSDPMKVELNGYPLETLYANIAKLPARDVTIVIDACFSGSSASGAIVRSASSISLKVVDTKVRVPKATVFTAAGVAEVASWDQDANLGLFTRHFLEGASGKADGQNFGNSDGRVSVAEMKKYLEEEVTYRARRMYGRDQNPQINGDLHKILIRADAEQ